MGNTKSRIPGICKGKVEMSEDFEEFYCWEEAIGDSGWMMLHDLYRLGYVKKHVMIAMLDENGCFNEALDNMAGDAYEEERTTQFLTW